jgi:hypothetical protein
MITIWKNATTLFVENVRGKYRIQFVSLLVIGRDPVAAERNEVICGISTVVDYKTSLFIQFTANM